MIRKQTLLIAACIVMVLVTQLKAIILLAPATELTQLANHFELLAEVAQAVNIYNQAVAQAKYVKTAGAYKTLWRGWLGAAAVDTYGHNGGFVSNENGSLGGISGSLRKFPDFGGVLGPLHPKTVDRIQWQYDEAELHDGIAQQLLDTAGDIHSNDQNANLSSLDGLVFSTDDGDNSAVQEAHKTAMGVAITAHQNEDIKRLLSALAAERSLDLKVRRDGFEHAMTEQQDWLSRAQAGEPLTYVSGASAALDKYLQ